MKKISGMAASPGIVIGRAYVVLSESFRVLPRAIGEDEIEPEIERFRKAIDESREEILDIKRKFEETANEPAPAEIFDTHIHLLQDLVFTEETIRKVREQKRNIEFVFSENLGAIVRQLSSVGDEYFRQRSRDIEDVGGRILRKLLRRKKRPLSNLPDKAIVISHDITPADTASMDRENVLAFATDAGGRTSHTAIMAKALEIPAVVGLQDITRHVRNDDFIIVDGLQGVVIVSPDEQTLNEYQIRRDRYIESERALEKLKDLPAQTVDGTTIELMANIDMPIEIESAFGHGAEGIGLFRTEFLFLNRTVPPSEDEQAEAYTTVAERMNPNPITIRTLDIGGDKLLGGFDRYSESNPFMGCRAIRFCLDHPEIFRPQLRAILRASARGKVRLMLPMITGLLELRQSLQMLEEAKKELEAEGIPFDTNMPVGVMIETPSAVLIADILAKEADFFSIGTNDLIQYSLAVDRINERVAHLYQPAHPGIIRMIKLVIDAAERENIALSVCGEIASELPITLVLIGLGIRDLSMTATAIPEVKKLIRSISLKDAEELASKALNLSTSSDIRSEIHETIIRVAPNYSDHEFFSWAQN